MGFQKGNKLASKKKGMKYAPTRYTKEVGEQLVSLSPQYNECLVRMMAGEDLPKPVKEAMDRFEKMYEFARPKLQRTESSVDQKVTFTQYDNKPDSELEEELNRLSASLSREKQKKV